MSGPKISVIIPVFNVAEYLEESLNSVLSQTLKNIEIICINDGSTDHSLGILRSYEAENGNIYVLDQKNQGVGLTRNRGIQFARGEFIAFMDPDDFYPDNQVLEDLYYNAKNNDVFICGGSFSYFNDNQITDNFLGVFGKYTFTGDQIREFTDYQFPYGFHRYIYHTEFLKEHHVFFPEYSRGEDLVFVAKAMIKAKKFYAISRTAYRYRKGHKFTSLNLKRTKDCMKAAIDLMALSKENELRQLHEMSLSIITDDLYPAIFKYLKQKELEVVELLDKVSNVVDQTILTKECTSALKNYPLDSNKLSEFMDFIKDKEEHFNNIIKSYDKIVIYGAGYVGRRVADYLHYMHRRNDCCFVVTEMESHPKYVEDINVRGIDDFINERDRILVILATKESLQTEIINHLKLHEFNNIHPIVYREFRLFGLSEGREILV